MTISAQKQRPLSILLLADNEAVGLAGHLQAHMACPVTFAASAAAASQFYSTLNHRVVIIDPVHYFVSGDVSLDHEETSARTKFLNATIAGRSRIIIRSAGDEQTYQHNWGKRPDVDYHAFVQKGAPVEQLQQAIAYALALPPLPRQH